MPGRYNEPGIRPDRENGGANSIDTITLRKSIANAAVLNGITDIPCVGARYRSAIMTGKEGADTAKR